MTVNNMATKKVYTELETVTVTLGGVDHVFSEPTGNDLVAYEQALKSKEVSELEGMAILASILSEDPAYSPEYFLGLSFKRMKEVSLALNGFFS